MKAFAGLVFLVVAALADNGCPQDQALDWKIEKVLPHKQCNKFYKCAHGQPVEMQCPSILFFNQDTSRCDWPSLVDCTGRQLPGSSEESEEVAGAIGIQDPNLNTIDTSLDGASNATDENTEAETEQEVESPEVVLPETSTIPSIELKENGCPVDPLIHWLTPHEDDCTLFYYCDWDTKVLRQCAPYTHFNRDLQVCDYPERAGCLNETLTR
ncbi:peritrophin-1-like [Zerene cesonia]|uniref:peritrophin-1-like n=1 Tax=Zerene cesonia TaxID=33412 RepID=UPI0018E5A561|nr:peritrophin-1-like [Zerene cesonia]